MGRKSPITCSYSRILPSSHWKKKKKPFHYQVTRVTSSGPIMQWPKGFHTHTWEQGFSKSNVKTHHLGILLKCRFWFSRIKETLIPSKLPGNADATAPWRGKDLEHFTPAFTLRKEERKGTLENHFQVKIRSNELLTWFFKKNTTFLFH